MKRAGRRKRVPGHGVTLQQVADYVKLTKGTVSNILNGSPSAQTIPEKTKQRVYDAVRLLNYQPNFFARTLAKKRTFTVGVITEGIGDAYGGIVVSGIESFLSAHKYFFMAVAHRHNAELLEQYSELLRARGIEGLLIVDSVIMPRSPLPMVAVAGHQHIAGVTNVILDHDLAASLVLRHVVELGHRRIAFMRGQPFSADSSERWLALCRAAQTMGVEVCEDRTIQIQEGGPTPDPGFHTTKRLLARRKKFSALVSYNDISAIGAMRALREHGLSVPDDVSVVGFDDIREAAYCTPSLTTVRQPLFRMGALAAEILVERIEKRSKCPDQVAVAPELVVRESTAPLR